MSEKRINCYECRYRGTIPGDAHSGCWHPEVIKTGLWDNYFTALAEAYIGKAEGARHKLGILGGGMTWPENFNPTFLTACRGFESKDDESKEGSCQK